MELPSKLKMGVSGCLNTCAESSIKDIGLIGTAKGWKLLAGGSSGIKPRIADLIAEGLDDDEALKLVDRIIEFVKDRGEKKRLGRIIDGMGLEAFKSAVL
jgi:NAD(P)H-nitrite reductase large subunit